MTKAKLKQRILDICNGAGYLWIEDGEYFEAQNGPLEDVGSAIQGIERSFDLPVSNRLRSPWHLKKFDDIDSLVDLVKEAIEYDKQPTD